MTAERHIDYTESELQARKKRMWLYCFNYHCCKWAQQMRSASATTLRVATTSVAVCAFVVAMGLMPAVPPPVKPPVVLVQAVTRGEMQDTRTMSEQRDHEMDRRVSKIESAQATEANDITGLKTNQATLSNQMDGIIWLNRSILGSILLVLAEIVVKWIRKTAPKED